MKKAICIILCLITACSVGLFGCGKKPAQNSSGNNGGDIGGDSQTAANLNTIHKVSATETSDYVLNGGKTDYVVVYSKNATTNEAKAVSVLTKFFLEATGVKLTAVTDENLAWSESARYISVGDTTALKSSKLSYEYTSSGGFRIKTVGKTVFLYGGSRGVTYAAYEILNYWFNFEYCAAESYLIDTNVKNVKLYNYDVTEIPDIEYSLNYIATGNVRSTGDVYLQDAWRAVGDVAVGFQHNIHNSFFYVPPIYPLPDNYTDFHGINSRQCSLKTNADGSLYVDPTTGNYVTCRDATNYLEEHPEWFAEGDYQYGLPTQLCYSRDPDGLIEVILPKIKYCILDSDCSFINISHQDLYTWCQCSTCTAYKQAYGEDVAVYLIFLNKLADKVAEWQKTDERVKDREIFIQGVVYQKNEDAPAHYDEASKKYVFNTPDLSKVTDKSALIHGENLPALDLKDNISILYCDTKSDKMFELTDKVNQVSYNNLQSWGNLVKNLNVWTYNLAWYNGHYLQYSDRYDLLQSYYQYYVSYGTNYMLDQGIENVTMGGNPSGFQVLKAYLSHKLAFNCQENVQTLTDNYFKACFGPAKEQMLTLFMMARTNMQTLHDNGTIGSGVYDLVNKNYYTLGLLDSMINQIDLSLQAIESLKTSNYAKYKVYKNNIVRESITWRYIKMYLYEDSYSEAEALAEKKSIKADCESVGLTGGGAHYTGSQDIKELWKYWGV